MSAMPARDPVSRDILAIFERARSRLFVRLEGLTDAEYLWEPVSDCISIRPGEDGVFRVATLIPEPVPGVPDPVTSIAWRIWHIGALCLRGYVMNFFEDVSGSGDRLAWPGTAKAGVEARAIVRAAESTPNRMRIAGISVSLRGLMCRFLLEGEHFAALGRH